MLTFTRVQLKEKMRGRMNYKEYLELLTKDLNIIFKNEPTTDTLSQREKEHYFRVKILIFHLHADYLLSEIIREKFQAHFNLRENKENFEVKDMEFIEKLRIFHTINFDEGIFTTLRILNKIRNNLSHNLIIDLIGQEKKLEASK